MNILHLTPWQEPCGIAGYAADLIAALETCGVRNEVHPFNRRGRLYPLAAEVQDELDRACSRAKTFDLVHVQHEFSIFNDASGRADRGVAHLGYLLARLWKMRKSAVVTFHTEPEMGASLHHLKRGLIGVADIYRSFRFQRSWRRHVVPYFRRQGRNLAIVHTSKARACLVESGFDSRCVVRMPIGLTPRNDRFQGIDRNRARAVLGYKADDVVLSLFGFIAAYKGHDLAASALSRLPNHFRLAIVGGPHPLAGGDATLDSILEMTADSSSLKDRLRVTGFVPPRTIDQYHAATDICLAPYRNFNLSASAGITWALTSGRPVVASKIPPFQEVNDETECLLTFTENAEHELAWQIERLHGDVNLQERLVRNASVYAQNHSWASVAESLHALYAGILGKPRFPRIAIARAA